MSTIFLSYDGFFISEKLKKIFKSYKIGNFQYLNTTIHGLDNYTYLNLAKKKIINFEKSCFKVINTISNTNAKVISIGSHKDFLDKNKDLLMTGKFQYKVVPTLVCLNEAYDLFNSPIALGILVSEQLKNKLEEQQLTGIEFKETDIEFYIEE